MLEHMEWVYVGSELGVVHSKHHSSDLYWISFAGYKAWIERSEIIREDEAVALAISNGLIRGLPSANGLPIISYLEP